MKDIMKIVKSLDSSGLLMKVVSKTIENKAKEQKGGFLGMLLGTLGAILLRNLSKGKRAITTSLWGGGVIRPVEEATYNESRRIRNNRSTTTFLMPPHVYRIQVHDSIMCGYFCNQFIDLLLNNKRLRVRISLLLSQYGLWRF